MLTDAYGVEGSDEHQRLDVYELLHMVHERSWVNHDRPAGWQQSSAVLDAMIAARTRPVRMLRRAG